MASPSFSVVGWPEDDADFTSLVLVARRLPARDVAVARAAGALREDAGLFATAVLADTRHTSCVVDTLVRDAGQIWHSPGPETEPWGPTS